MLSQWKVCLWFINFFKIEKEKGTTKKKKKSNRSHILQATCRLMPALDLSNTGQLWPPERYILVEKSVWEHDTIWTDEKCEQKKFLDS